MTDDNVPTGETTFLLEVTVEPTEEAIVAVWLLQAQLDLSRAEIAGVLSDVLSHTDEFALELPWRVSRIRWWHGSASAAAYRSLVADPDGQTLYKRNEAVEDHSATRALHEFMRRFNASDNRGDEALSGQFGETADADDV